MSDRHSPSQFDLKRLFRVPTVQQRVAGLQLRPDLAAAAVLLVAGERVDAEVKALESWLEPNESVIMLLEGRRRAGRTARSLGLLVLTSQRVLFRPHGAASDAAPSMAAANAGGGAGAAAMELPGVAAEHRIKAMSGRVTLRSADQVLEVDRILGQLAGRFAAAVLDQQRPPADGRNPPPAAGPLQQLVELSDRWVAGTVSANEYEAGKRRLLDEL